jgi:K+-transporting ATPase KdpF subunit
MYGRLFFVLHTRPFCFPDRRQTFPPKFFMPRLHGPAIFLQVFYTQKSKVWAGHPCSIGESDGRAIPGPSGLVFRLGLPAGSRLQCFGRKTMSWLYAVSGGLSLLLLVYLIYALLRPEEF